MYAKYYFENYPRERNKKNCHLKQNYRTLQVRKKIFKKKTSSLSKDYINTDKNIHFFLIPKVLTAYQAKFKFYISNGEFSTM